MIVIMNFGVPNIILKYMKNWSNHKGKLANPHLKGMLKSPTMMYCE